MPAAPTPEQWVTDIEKILHEFLDSGYSSKSHVNKFIKEHSRPSLGGFGSHTTCVEIKSKNSQIIIDGGSGLRNLGMDMMNGPAGKGKGEVHIFMTHFHWDHLLGIPFFAPHFIKGNTINYYAVQPDLPDIIKLKFRKPMFPVAYEALPVKTVFNILEPRKTIRIGDFAITPYQLDHPDPCWGFKVEKDDLVYAHCVDTEGTRVTPEALGPDLPLYQGVDVMYYDAQYTLPELAEKINWGHSAAQIGLDLAFREKIKYVVFAHHDPGHNTSQIYELKDQTKEYYDWKVSAAEANHGSALFDVKWRYAYEGLTIDMSKYK